VDTSTGKRTSLGTANEDEARQVVAAKNNSERQPVLNLQIAKAYLAGSDKGMTTRTWQNAIESLIGTKQGANQHRWKTAAKDKALAMLLPQVIIESKGEAILKVLQMGTVSTNVYLRRLHNFCVDMNWLPWPLVPKRQWPAVEFKEKRGITLAEHLAIVARENNPERKAFYKLAWHLGASQSDLAGLNAEDVDWNTTSSAMRARRPARLPSCAWMETWRKSCATCRAMGRCFHICEASVRATVPRSSNNAAMDLASKAFRCTATATLGRNGRRRRLSRTVCPGESWAQQPGHDAGIFPQGSGGNAVVERIRAATEGHYWNPQPEPAAQNVAA